MKTLIASILLALTLAPVTPVATYDKDSELFTATFSPGATWGCIQYVATEPVLNRDGTKTPYQFGFCAALDPSWESVSRGWNNVNCYADDIDQTGCKADVDYNVYFVIQYDKAPDANGVVTFDEVTSNTVTARH